MSILLILAILFAIIGEAADVFTTIKAMASGKGHEANPLAAWFIKVLGNFWWVGDKAPFAVLLGIALYQGNDNVTMIVAAIAGVAGFGAAVWNYIALKKVGVNVF